MEGGRTSWTGCCAPSGGGALLRQNLALTTPEPPEQKAESVAPFSPFSTKEEETTASMSSAGKISGQTSDLSLPGEDRTEEQFRGRYLMDGKR